LREALDASELDQPPVLREVLLTSHSPFVVSDCRQENVLVFKKDEETMKVSYDRPEFNTFGASANAITMKIFDQSDTIGDYAVKEFSKLRQRLKSGEDPNSLIEEASSVLGESIETVIFMNEALDLIPEK
jgi:predicted ATP-binding protein involved in virulence